MEFNQQNIKIKLKELILQLRQHEGEYYKKIQNLKSYFIQIKSSQLVGSHSNAISYAKTGIYYQLNTKKSVKQLLNLYKKFNKLFEQISNKIGIQRSELLYAIYYEQNGKIYRLTQKNISVKDVRKGTSALKLSLSQMRDKIKDAEVTEQVNKHYQTFVGAINATYNGESKLPNDKINFGHLVEAFERHMLDRHGGMSNENFKHEETGQPPFDLNYLWSLIRSSKGNAPWYTGGDVSYIQVKSVRGGDVRLSSYDTFEDLINLLIYLTNPNQDLQEQVKLAYKIFTTQLGDSQPIIQQYTVESTREWAKKMGFNVI